MRLVVVILPLLLLALLSAACHLAFPFTLPDPIDASVEAAPNDATVDAPGDAPLANDGPAAEQASLDLDPTGPDAPPADAPPADAPPADAPTPDLPSPPDAPSPDGASSIPGTWTTIPAGTFQMGSPATEPCRGGGAGPQETQHPVTLNHSLLIQTTEVTQGQYTLVMGYNPSQHAACGPTCPVERVTWHEAAAYCNALSDLAALNRCYKDAGGGSACSAMTTCKSAGEVCIKGFCRSYTPDPVYNTTKIHTCPGYRLPTEAEWEYAYRATTTTAYYSGGLIGACTGCVKEASAELIGWYCKNAYSSPRPAAQKAANSWGLHDMAGNVWEWCNDCYLADLKGLPQTDPDPACPPSTRVLRGGAFNMLALKLRAAQRYGASPQALQETWGFRCVRTK